MAAQSAGPEARDLGAAGSSQDTLSGTRTISRYGSAESVWRAVHAGQRGKMLLSSSVIDAWKHKPAHVRRRLEQAQVWRRP